MKKLLIKKGTYIRLLKVENFFGQKSIKIGPMFCTERDMYFTHRDFTIPNWISDDPAVKLRFTLPRTDRIWTHFEVWEEDLEEVEVPNKVIVNGL